MRVSFRWVELVKLAWCEAGVVVVLQVSDCGLYSLSEGFGGLEVKVDISHLLPGSVPRRIQI